MLSVTRPAAVAVAACLVLPTAVGAASSAGTYKGKATADDGKFKFGKVAMKVKGAKVVKLEIQAVTTDGCGGFMDVVFAPTDSETQITKGSATIKGGRLSVTYRPVSSVEDQTTTIRARVSGGRVTGTFKSGDLCKNSGRFTAKR